MESLEQKLSSDLTHKEKSDAYYDLQTALAHELIEPLGAEVVATRTATSIGWSALWATACVTLFPLTYPAYKLMSKIVEPSRYPTPGNLVWLATAMSSVGGPAVLWHTLKGFPKYRITNQEQLVDAEQEQGRIRLIPSTVRSDHYDTLYVKVPDVPVITYHEGEVFFNRYPHHSSEVEDIEYSFKPNPTVVEQLTLNYQQFDAYQEQCLLERRRTRLNRPRDYCQL